MRSFNIARCLRLVSAITVWVFALQVHGQKPIYLDYPNTREQPQTAKWTPLPEWLSFDTEVRGRTEGQTSLNEVSSNDRIYELTRVRGGISIVPAPFLRGYLQFQDTHALGLPLPQVASNQRDQFDLFQGYLDIHPLPKLDLVTGRQMLRYGNERLVGISDWTNNSRTWDGFVGHYGGKDWIEAFATSVVVTTYPTSLDKHGTGLTFYGLVGTLTTVIPQTQIQPFVYIRRVSKVTSQESRHGSELETTFGAEVNGHIHGNFEYDLLAALQRGAYANDSIHSGVAYAKAGYVLRNLPLKPRLTGEYDYATGNSGRQANRVGTFDQLYPSNHDAFGLVDLFGFDNITQARVNVDLAPTPNLTFLFQSEYLNVASVRDGVYSAAGTVLIKPPATGFTNTDIGQGLDASAEYLFRKYFDVQVGVGHLFPGRVLVQGGKAPPLTLGYFQITYILKLSHHDPTPGVQLTKNTTR